MLTTTSVVIAMYVRRTNEFRGIDGKFAQSVPVDDIVVAYDRLTEGTTEAVGGIHFEQPET